MLNIGVTAVVMRRGETSYRSGRDLREGESIVEVYRGGLGGLGTKNSWHFDEESSMGWL